MNFGMPKRLALNLHKKYMLRNTSSWYSFQNLRNPTRRGGVRVM